MWHVKQQFRIILSNSFDKMDNTWNGEDFFRLRMITSEIFQNWESKFFSQYRIFVTWLSMKMVHAILQFWTTCIKLLILDAWKMLIGTTSTWLCFLIIHRKTKVYLHIFLQENDICNRDSTCSFAIMIRKFSFCPVLKTKGQTSIFLSTLSF